MVVEAVINERKSQKNPGKGRKLEIIRSESEVEIDRAIVRSTIIDREWLVGMIVPGIVRGNTEIGVVGIAGIVIDGVDPGTIASVDGATKDLRICPGGRLRARI